MIQHAILEAIVKQLGVVDRYTCDVAGMRQQIAQYDVMPTKERAELAQLYETAMKKATNEDFPCVVTTSSNSMRHLLQYKDTGITLTPILREVNLQPTYYLIFTNRRV